MKVRIIGVDCATQPPRMGLAVGEHTATDRCIIKVAQEPTQNAILDRIVSWINPAIPTLLALDAPLGWPADLGQLLVTHQAGQPLDIPANQLFRRLTDRVIKKEIGKQSLDVGADRIARTAHAALNLLDEISQRVQQPIPLAWQTPLTASITAIEVYPAATLSVYNLIRTGYKGSNGQAIRQEMIKDLAHYIDLPAQPELMIENDDVFDAAVCILAGIDFLQGQTIPPTDWNLAKKEGWMWVRRPKGDDNA